MVSGFALGGFSEGFNRAQRRGLEKQRVGLQSRALDIQEQDLKASKLRKQLNLSLETLQPMVQAIEEIRKAGGTPGNELVTAATGLARQIDTFGTTLGVGSNIGTARVQAALSAERELTGEEQTARALPEVQKSLADAGVEVSTKDLAVGAGLINKPDQPKVVEAMVNGEQRFFQQSLDDNGNIILEQVDTEARPVPSGLSFRVGPDGSVEVASGGAQLSGLTRSSQSAEQETQRQTQELLSNLQNVSSALEEGGGGVVGLPGAVKGVLNVTAAQVSDELFSQDRSEFERNVKILRQSALRVVSDESRFSEADRDFIFELFPSTGVFESRQAAQDKIRIMQAFFARRLLQSAERTGTEEVNVPDLSMDEIVDMVVKGSLTEKEGRKLVELLGGTDGDQSGG